MWDSSPLALRATSRTISASKRKGIWVGGPIPLGYATTNKKIAVAPDDTPFGAPDHVLQIALRNFAEIRTLVLNGAERDDIDRLEAWTRLEYAAHRDTMATRRQAGFVRECHGDAR